MPNRPLRVLLTCRELVHHAGSQLYTRDVAEVLREGGHSPVVFSPRLGEVAAELRRRGVAVVDDLERLGEPPHVIHGQHHLEAMAAMLRFPTVPALFVCHGWLAWQEAPPRFPSLRRYAAVDALRRDRLVLEHGVPESQVTLLLNFVDLERFRPRGPLPERPRRALLFSNQASRDTFAPAVADACSASAIRLDVVGLAAERPVARPEEVLPDYDLVFARGRAALEAMAVGAAVVLCDVEGCGPLVDEGNFDALRQLNFGFGTLRAPVTAERLRQEIARYDPHAAARVRERVRREADRRPAVARLLELYEELVREAPRLAGEEHARACLEAASRYLRGLAPDWESFLELPETRQRLARARAEAASARGALAAARAGHWQQRAAAAEAALAALERSPFTRLRARLLAVRPLVAAYRHARRWLSRPEQSRDPGLDRSPGQERGNLAESSDPEVR